MGGIHEEHVEWAVINRLKAMIDQPPQTDFNVTLGFSLFSAVLLWSKNRMWLREIDAASQADKSALAARAALGDTRIVDPPWSLSRTMPALHGEGPVNDEFETMPAWEFFKWLRDALAHGDGRSIRPIHWQSHETGGVWLGGFHIVFPRSKNLGADTLSVHLFKADLQRLGSQLADLFCKHLAQGDDYYFSDIAAKAISEADFPTATKVG